MLVLQSLLLLHEFRALYAVQFVEEPQFLAPPLVLRQWYPLPLLPQSSFSPFSSLRAFFRKYIKNGKIQLVFGGCSSVSRAVACGATGRGGRTRQPPLTFNGVCCWIIKENGGGIFDQEALKIKIDFSSFLQINLRSSVLQELVYSWICIF